MKREREKMPAKSEEEENESSKRPKKIFSVLDNPGEQSEFFKNMTLQMSECKEALEQIKSLVSILSDRIDKSKEIVAQAKEASVPLVTVGLFNLGDTISHCTFRIPPTMIWGDLFQTYFYHNKAIPGHLSYEYMEYTIRDQGTLGHDVRLNSPVGPKDVKVTRICLGWTHRMIIRPFTAWKKGKEWPPCTNYYDNEPLNFQAVGCYRDGNNSGRCDIREGKYDREDDNGEENMIILNLGPSRIGYNKYMLRKWLSNNITEPTTGQEMTQATIDAIKKSAGFYSVTKIHWKSA